MRIDSSSTQLVLCPMVPSDPALGKLAVEAEHVALSTTTEIMHYFED